MWLGNYLKHFYPSEENISCGKGTEEQSLVECCSPRGVSSLPWASRVSLQTHRGRSVSRHASCGQLLLPCNVRFPASHKSCYQASNQPDTVGEADGCAGKLGEAIRLGGKEGGREDLKWRPNWWASLLSQVYCFTLLECKSREVIYCPNHKQTS